MREMIFNILRFLGAMGVLAFFVYLRYKSLQNRVKDLGDGGIQRVFHDQERK
jgi:hypothetical protein